MTRIAPPADKLERLQEDPFTRYSDQAYPSKIPDLPGPPEDPRLRLCSRDHPEERNKIASVLTSS